MKRNRDPDFVPSTDQRSTGIVMQCFSAKETRGPTYADEFRRVHMRRRAWWAGAELNCRHQDFQSARVG